MISVLLGVSHESILVGQRCDWHHGNRTITVVHLFGLLFKGKRRDRKHIPGCGGVTRGSYLIVDLASNSYDLRGYLQFARERQNKQLYAVSHWLSPRGNVRLSNDDEHVKIFSSSSLNRLRELLESPHLDVRLSAGEALAVIFELGRDFSCDYEQNWALDLIEILKELATDSNKYRAKKDRKQQRANFRDILHYIEVGSYIVQLFIRKKFLFVLKTRLGDRMSRYDEALHIPFYF